MNLRIHSRTTHEVFGETASAGQLRYNPVASQEVCATYFIDALSRQSLKSELFSLLFDEWFRVVHQLSCGVAVFDLQLFDQIVDVIFDSVEGDRQTPRNLLIAQPVPSDQFQNLTFSRSQAHFVDAADGTRITVELADLAQQRIR